MIEGYERKVPLDEPLTEIELTAIGGHKATRVEFDVKSRGGAEEAIKLMEDAIRLMKADLNETTGDRLAVSTFHATMGHLARQAKVLAAKERQSWEHRVASSRENVASLPLRTQARQR